MMIFLQLQAAYDAMACAAWCFSCRESNRLSLTTPDPHQYTQRTQHDAGRLFRAPLYDSMRLSLFGVAPCF